MLETQISEKKATFPVKKKFWLFFLVLSSETNLKDIIIGENKVF